MNRNPTPGGPGNAKTAVPAAARAARKPPVPPANLGQVPTIKMDKVLVAASAKGEAGSVLTAPEVPMELLDTSKKPGVKYLRGRFLGKGGFAKCYEVTEESTGEVFACKVVHKNLLMKTHHREKMVQEIMIHRNLKHVNIVNFHSHFEDDVFVYIVLELCEKKSLLELSKRRRTITEPEARFLLRQICEGVRYLHDEKNIIHRDLKLGNIFISNSVELKIGDFGLATQLEKDGLRKRTMCGTPNYIAPEVLSKTGHGFEVDMWSVGCILYTLLIGKPPFETDSLKETYKKIRLGDFVLPAKINLSPLVKRLIQRLLQVDPSKRPTAREILMDDFLMKCFVPDNLPVSALTMAPKFPSAAAQARTFGGKHPLHEVNQNPRSTTQVVQKIGSETVTLSKPGPSASSLSVDESGTFDGSSDAGAVPVVELLRSLRAQMKDVITGITGNTRMLESDDDSEDPSLAPMLFIIKWVDYSDKYGFGYQLCDDSIGVTFNDQTKMILMPDSSNFVSITKEGVETYHTVDNYFPVMEKKIKLLKYFQKYMHENLLRPVAPASSTACIPRLPNMYTWFRTSRTVVMALTNGTLQLNNFKTHRKIILCPTMGAVSIIEPNLPMRTYKLTQLLVNGCTETMKIDLLYSLDKLEAICRANEAVCPSTIKPPAPTTTGTKEGK